MNHDTLNIEALTIPYLETTTFGNYTIKIEQDDVHDSPRDWEPLGTMLCWPRGYGDAHGYETPDVFYHVISGLYPDHTTEDLSTKQRARCVTVAEANNIILPLYIYSHSGVEISTTPFSCHWDSARVGLIYVSKEDIRKEYSVKSVSQKRHKEVIGYLENEVKVYNQYINGEIYYFNVEKTDEDGDTVDVDSCGGFLGYDDDYMISVIKEAITYDIKATPQQTEMF